MERLRGIGETPRGSIETPRGSVETPRTSVKGPHGAMQERSSAVRIPARSAEGRPRAVGPLRRFERPQGASIHEVPGSTMPLEVSSRRLLVADWLARLGATAGDLEARLERG